MLVGIDARPVSGKSSGRRGIGKYCRNLIQALLETDSKYEFVLYGFRGSIPDFGALSQWRGISRFDKPRLNWVLDSLFLKNRLSKDGVEIFHGTEITALPGPPSRGQVWATVYDLIPFVFREQTERLYPYDFRLALRRSWKRLKEVDRIITISSFSKQDICSKLGVPDSKVHVVYPGRDQSFHRIDPGVAEHRLREVYGIDSSFLFYVGGSDFRKNLILLLEAFSEFRKIGYGGRLVMAGETFQWGVEEVWTLKKKISLLNLGDAVVFPGYVPDSDLPCFYSACDAFVFPSFYEGFGLPVLEAMQCGAPVVCSRATSIPEVIGDCAAYFDPGSLDGLVDALELACGDDSRTQRWRTEALARSERFDWNLAAREIIGLYEKYG